MKILNNKANPLFLVIILILSFSVYQQGLKGDFLFDDYSNLEPMGALGGVVNIETFAAFVTTGWSGPSGRPISLASFLLDDNTWPSYAPWFKHTNLLIHIICGLLLCWAALLLARNLQSVTEQQAQWIALLTCALWMLHPYMMSTTLYVVQRMAQLATLFSLTGIVLYLHARLYLADNPKHSYFWMTCAIGVFTLLATFSKENGALLPLLILCIEFCLPRDGKPAWQWRSICLWLPSIALGLMLARYITFADAPWPNRNFNMVERLLTEARIVTEYLFHLFVPRIEGNGLYQDGYVISRSLWQPLTTLPAIAFLASLLGVAFWIRKQAPVISLAILFFFTAHLMESTVIGLELYFEHRNYLAALFLFLPLAWYCVILTPKYKSLPIVAIALLAILSSMTWLRSTLWSDNDKLELYWAQSATNSPRAINSMAAFYINHGKLEKANSYLEEQSQRLDQSSLLTARLLLQKVYTDKATEQDFTNTAQRLKHQEFDAQTVKGVRTIVEKIIERKNKKHAVQMLGVLDVMQESPIYSQFPLFIRLQYYLRGQLYLLLDQSEHMLAQYKQAIEHYNETDAALAMIAEVASAGYVSEARILLKQAERVFQNQKDRTLKRSRMSYQNDIKRIQDTLDQAIAEQGNVQP